MGRTSVGGCESMQSQLEYGAEPMKVLKARVSDSNLIRALFTQYEHTHKQYEHVSLYT